MAARTQPVAAQGAAPRRRRATTTTSSALARELLPELAARARADRFDVLVDTIVAVFDGETVHRFVLDKPELEAARLALLSSLAHTLLPPRRAPPR